MLRETWCGGGGGSRRRIIFRLFISYKCSSFKVMAEHLKMAIDIRPLSCSDTKTITKRPTFLG